MRKHQATAGTTTFLDHSESEVKVDRKRLLQKIDLHVMPTLFLIYMPLSWIGEHIPLHVPDLPYNSSCRVNISNALTMNLPTDLGLSGQQPSIALTVFFVPYIVFEIPPNVLMKRFQPRIWRR